MKESQEFQKIQKVIINKLREKQMPNETIDEISQSMCQSIISKIESCKKGKLINSQCASDYSDLVSYEINKCNSKFTPKASLESSVYNSFNRNILQKKNPFYIN